MAILLWVAVATLLGSCSADIVSLGDSLNIDVAAVRFVNHLNSTIEVQYRSHNCYRCLPRHLTAVDPGQTTPYNTTLARYGTTLFFLSIAGASTFDFDFKEHGFYTFALKQVPGDVLVDVTVDRSPDDTYKPIWMAALLLSLGGAAWSIAKTVYRTRARAVDYGQDQEVLLASASGGATTRSPDKPAKRKRLRSLDTFRGLSLCIMIFVNYNGGGYWFFAHSLWNGLTVADLVFPWFIWIMGTAMAFSFASLKRRQVPKKQVLYKVVRRTAILFALGLLVSNGGVSLAEVRVPGVLQRFAVSYFFVALLHMYCPQGTSQGPFADIVNHWAEWIVVLCFVAIWLCLTFLLDVPGCGRGYLGPGGIGDEGQHRDCTGGAAGYIDRKLLGNHIYQTPTCQVMYQTGAYDPEGILGCLTSITLCYLGTVSGRILVYYKDHKQRLGRWLVWGVVLGVVALGLCGGTQNGGAIPVAKNLWSLSFITCMASMAFFLLSFLYIIMDVKTWYEGQPFIYPGMNSIVVYVSSEVLQNFFPFSYNPSTEYPSHGFELLMNLVAVGYFCLAAYYMHRKDFFIAI